MSFSFSDFIAGWGAGVCGLLVGHPADTIKVRQQVARDSSITKILLSTLKHEGVSGLYKGMLFPLLFAGALNSLFFGVFANSLRLLQTNQNADPNKKTCAKRDQPNPLWHYNVFLAGCAGGLAQFFLACPVDIVKIKLQTQRDQQDIRKKSVYNVRKCVKGIYKQSRWRGFYHGWNVMLCRDVPSSGIYILVYEHLLTICSPHSDDNSYPVLCRLLSGGLAGTISWISIIPLDVLKSRMQADDPTNPRYKGVKDCLSQSYAKDGLRAFGRGFWMVSMRAFPVNAATFVGYEWCLQACHKVQAMLNQSTF